MMARPAPLLKPLSRCALRRPISAPAKSLLVSLRDARCAESMSEALLEFMRFTKTANEYLCKVRCGIVKRDGVRDEDVPQAANLASHGDSVDELAEGRSKVRSIRMLVKTTGLK
ncbi:uncharacterized protein LOC120288927 [Eucalyptus grandis]|uniref:uncharacterized protein LOC120288927 n=1 Tax=Eucalyptus grandis TaxID=71139 RepID=UPI00192E97D5|nr:uncharacterized protein LOC120288927 [Eucalyptus grandis]